jgi:hypothetical protein
LKESLLCCPLSLQIRRHHGAYWYISCAVGEHPICKFLVACIIFCNLTLS